MPLLIWTYTAPPDTPHNGNIYEYILSFTGMTAVQE